MNDHPGAMPGWNLALRFLVELAAFVGWGWAGWHLADGLPAIVATAALPVIGAILGTLVLVHIGFSLGRTRWLLQQR